MKKVPQAGRRLQSVRAISAIRKLKEDAKFSPFGQEKVPESGENHASKPANVCDYYGTMASFATEQETRLRTVLESIPNGIVGVDDKGVIFLCNTEAQRMFGYEPAELIGKSIELLVPQGSRGVHPQLREQFMEHPVKRRMGAGRDLSGRRKDGSEFPVEIGLNPLESETGMQVIASIVDITERKRDEAKLHQVYEEVEQRNREMEQFVHTISHDLRSPMEATMGFVEWIREDLAEGNVAEITEALSHIDQSTQHMRHLIDDLLKLSREGRMELKLEKVDIRRLLQTILDAAAPKIAAKKARVEVAPDFPMVIADPDRLRQVFENLLLNALKYGSGAPEPQIRLGWKDEGNTVAFYVADNGQGIPLSAHEKIFRLFERLDLSQEGTGIGLSIVARIAEIHGGRAWVESTPGEGATFWFTLPQRASV